jgi:hypothetical protein
VARQPAVCATCPLREKPSASFADALERASMSASSPALVAGRCRLIRRLAAGGMGEVFLAS